MTNWEHFLEKWLFSLMRFLRPERVYSGLLFCSGVAAIILFQTGVFPLTLSYTVFYFFLLVLWGLYRPNLLWSAVVFFLPFEIITVATFPVAGGQDIRAYQLGLVALTCATAILLIQGKKKMPTLTWFDGTLTLVLVGALLTFFGRQLPLVSFKEIIILFSLATLYLLGRVYLQKKKEVGVFLETLIVSGVVVAGYALYQLVALEEGWKHFMVMAGRPNSTFQEADWLGFFMGLVTLITFIAFLRIRNWYQEIVLGSGLVLFVMALIVTVSRSAWLSVGAGLITLAIAIIGGYWFYFSGEQKKERRILVKLLVTPPVVLVFSLVLISFFQLTRFDLSERLASTGTGEQVITVACVSGYAPPKSIGAIAELGPYHCEHIDLEERVGYQARSYGIYEVARPDPNIGIRSSIYQQASRLIQSHPFLGLGWGESLKAFGTDGRGAGLNSSNLFIEIWLGSGFLGILGFSLFWLGVVIVALIRLAKKREVTQGFWLSVLVLCLWIQVTVFNLFNAGLLLGTFIAILILFGWYGSRVAPRIRNIWPK